MTLAKNCRLSKGDLEKVFKKGKTVKSSFFFIKILRNEINHPRLAVITPAKFFKKATLRNRLKRIISEGFRKNIFSGNNFDVTISVPASILGKSTAEIKSELEKTIAANFVK